MRAQDIPSAAFTPSACMRAQTLTLVTCDANESRIGAQDSPFSCFQATLREGVCASYH